MWCENCGVSSEKARLFDVVSAKEKRIIKLCEKCSMQEGLPVVRRPTTFQLMESEKSQNYYEKVAANKRTMEMGRTEPAHQDVMLKDIVNKNYLKNVSAQKKPRPDLVDNFNWIIMRVRRLKKLTQPQLAKEISESEAAIRMAEKGVLPEDGDKLIRKIESFLGIKLVKDEKRLGIPEQKTPARILKFNPGEMEKLKIADLQRLKEQKEMLEPAEIEGFENFEEDEDKFK